MNRSTRGPATPFSYFTPTTHAFASYSRLRAALRAGLACGAALLLLVIATAAGLNSQTPALATVGLTPGWATFGEAVPQGVAQKGFRSAHC